ncbi:MAG TPA: polysaccharide biosynthesis tyrosine autokinase, partial [Gillisia sp.]|nr:polysaccharide biosynthesis tyrosine autokinase [Gillisia sp.]
KRLKDLGSASFEIIKTGDNFRITNLRNQTIFKVAPGNPVDLGFADVVLSANPVFGDINLSEPIIVKFSDAEKIAAQYRNKITLSQTSKSSGLLELELKDPVKEKARDILDQLVLEFNRSAIEDKNLIAGNTAKFINERLAIINDELDSVETGKESFKEQNRLTDIQAESQMYIQNASEYNKRMQEVGTQLELSKAMLEYIKSNPQTDLLPTNLGIEEAGVNQQINDYNALVLERNRILRGSSDKNPVVIRYNSQIDQIKGNIVQSLQGMRTNLRIGQEDLNRQASSIGSQIFAIPSKERQFRGIERQQNIKESLYLFLLQKREENSLSLAVTEPKAKIVDRAYYSDTPISPNSRSIYMGVVILGLFIPFSAIYFRGLMDNKIRKRSDFEDFANEIPLLAVLPRVNRNNGIIGSNDRSVLAEAFRILISNLQYFLVNLKDREKGVSIIITSTIKGEGKTFTAVNLSLTLANTGKKVLLLGMDLRNPKLHAYVLNSKDPQGVSDFLISDRIELQSLINKSSLHPELDILMSGSIPPNPYELLKQGKVKLMIAELEALYDYVIIDTAPSMLVADTFSITRFACLTLFMTRAGYTEKDLLEFALDAKEEGKLQKVSFVLNDVKSDNLGYGNKYGYGYGEDKKSFWSRKHAEFARRKKFLLAKMKPNEISYSGRFSAFIKMKIGFIKYYCRKYLGIGFYQ